MTDDKREFMRAYSVNEVSKILEVPPGTIRQWGRTLEDVLTIPRDEKGARYYTDLEIHTLQNIKSMRDKGLSFSVIREVLSNSKETQRMVPLPSVPTMSQSEAIETLQSLQATVQNLSKKFDFIINEKLQQAFEPVLEQNARLQTELEKTRQKLSSTLESLERIQQNQQKNETVQDEILKRIERQAELIERGQNLKLEVQGLLEQAGTLEEKRKPWWKFWGKE